MSLCFKCNKSIKPVSLATTVKGEKFHPTCIFCAICQRPLWGRPFKKNNDGSLVCDEICHPEVFINSVRMTNVNNRPSSAQKQQQFIIEQTKANTEPNYQLLDLEKYKKTSIKDIKLNESKTCNSCFQSIINKRFFTYENGEIFCEQCENFHIKNNNEISDVCTICGKLVKGSKYITERNGDKVCDNCESNGARCDKCNQLFKLNEVIRRLDFNLKYHDHCFNCKICTKLINSENFVLDESKTHPVCLDCDRLSTLPKCSVCNLTIVGPYLIFNNKPIHDICLKCDNCGIKLKNNDNNFQYKKNELPICTKCNNEFNGIKCEKCFQVIEKDGITFANKEYHSACFICQNCRTDLTKMKKTLTDKEAKNLFCEPCFVNQYAPRCNKCNEPIPPYLPGTVYEDKNYHKECFSCARCKRTLSNKKFFRSGNILICEGCF